MRTLITPSGFLVEDRPEGLYLIGDYKVVMEAEARAQENANMRGVADLNRFVVEFDYGEEPPFSKGVAEWGSANNFEDALRYALGAHFGSFEDPEVTVDTHERICDRAGCEELVVFDETFCIYHDEE